MNPALHALNRFGLGARPGEPTRIGEPKAWLSRQLRGPAPTLEDPALPDDAAIGDAIRALRQAQASRDEGGRRVAREAVQKLTIAEMRASLTARVATDRPYVERLVAFWSNHLCVSAASKPPVAPLAGAYERHAIRPLVLGRFVDMVLASARHPAMLVYLDNAQSIGPTSQAAQLVARRAGRERGLNENYARELMELHTVGVNGGYTQKDVQELARVLTGWTVAGFGGRPAALGGDALGRPAAGGAAPANGRVSFEFLPALHEPGARTVLGRRYAQDGEAQGEAVICALCAHPSTARFVATKLVRHFVADDPPPAAVARIADVFTRTDGDLREVSLALIELPEAWDPAHKKIRTPQDWLVAVLRGLGAQETPPNLPGALQQLRHPLWGPPSPKGWGDTVVEWADSASLMERAELAHTVAERVGGGANPMGVAELIDVPGTDPLFALLTDESIDATQRLALALAGPAFQWR